MTSNESDEDIRAIELVIARQFGSVSWSAEEESDWATFQGDFLPGATLYPATRPAKGQTVPALIERFKTLASSDLRSFEQSVLGTEIHVFGNVAVALGVCRNIENGQREIRGVEAFLLVKDEGMWRIASQAWDTEDDSKTVPAYLMSSKG